VLSWPQRLVDPANRRTPDLFWDLIESEGSVEIGAGAVKLGAQLDGLGFEGGDAGGAALPPCLLAGRVRLRHSRRSSHRYVTAGGWMSLRGPGTGQCRGEGLLKDDRGRRGLGDGIPCAACRSGGSGERKRGMHLGVGQDKGELSLLGRAVQLTAARPPAGNGDQPLGLGIMFRPGHLVLQSLRYLVLERYRARAAGEP
jgi:hypothetical protein